MLFVGSLKISVLKVIVSVANSDAWIIIRIFSAESKSLVHSQDVEPYQDAKTARMP